MDPSDESSEPGTADPTEDVATSPQTGRHRSRGLDLRTVAVCVCVALVAAIVAGLVVSIVADDGADTTSAPGPSSTLQPVREIDTEELGAVELLAVDGDKTRLSKLVNDKVTVVNLWAQSCAPCIEEMPWLEQTSRENADVAFLGVNVLDRLDNAQAMAAKTGITYPWVRDPAGSFGNAAQATGLPHTLLVDTDGTVLATKVGVFDSQDEIQAWLDEHRR